MTKLLIRLFIKNKEDTTSPAARQKYGLLASIVGILCNLLLFGIKIVLGTISGSIAITADAVNNLSDCGSSVITLVGFRLSAMPADEEHPYGHARIEYLSGLAVSLLVLVIGFDLLKSSFIKIRNPTPVHFRGILLVMLVISIGIKLWMGFFNRKLGRLLDSTALVATASDSFNDAYTTLAVLLSTLAAHFSGWQLDGWMGLIVAAFILWSGVGLIRQTLNPLLGAAPDQALVKAIEEKILSYPSVLGTHDLMVHNYGPGRCYASVHVEVPAQQDIMISHDVIDTIERDFKLHKDIDLVIHLDPIEMNDAQTNRMRDVVTEIIANLDARLSMHDFRMVAGASHSNLIFDVTVPPRYHMSNVELRQAIRQKVQEYDSQYYCVITLDRSYVSFAES